jgi:hypothetical protein
MSPVETPAIPTPAPVSPTPAANAPTPSTVTPEPGPTPEPGSTEFFIRALETAAKSAESATPVEAASDAAKETPEAAAETSPAAAETNPVLYEVPDAETAQEVVQTSAKYAKFVAGLDQIATEEDAFNFWDGLWKDFAVRDDKGNITGAHPAFGQLDLAIFNANAGALTKAAQETGNLHPILANLVHDGLDAVYAAAKKNPNSDDNADLIIAIDVLREIRPRPSNKGSAMTPEQKAAQSRTANEHKTAIATALSTVETEVAEAMVDQFFPMLEKAGLSEFTEEGVVTEIEKALKASLSKSPHYVQRKEQLTAAIRKNPTEENIAALKKHELAYGKMKIRRIAEEVLSKASSSGTTEPAGSADSIADSQAAWNADPKNAGTTMPLELHFNRIMGKAKK